MNDLKAQVFHDALVPTMPKGPDGITIQYPERFCDWMNKLDPHDCECEWVSPYGFAIASGCKVHDS